MITSLDGRVYDDLGRFDWAEPDAEVHAFANDLQRSVGTNLYGRRMYETMVAWETLDASPDIPSEMRDFAQAWRATEKIVYSTSLDQVWSGNTQLRSSFDADEVRRIADASPADVAVAGPTLAAVALEHGLVDELHQIIAPVVVGNGKGWLPDGFASTLELQEQRSFSSGFVYLRYSVSHDRFAKDPEDSADSKMSEPSGGLMRPHNLIEDHVFEISDRLTAADAEFCGCEKCLTDVMAFALAQIPPAYVSSEQGRAITEARLEQDNFHATITVKVAEALAAVKSHPRH